jgi:uncharacterized protein (DUF2235 family)
VVSGSINKNSLSCLFRGIFAPAPIEILLQWEARMPKKIVLLLDGTSNEISTNRSNILRLYGTLSKSKEQVVYYDPGVGTFGAENTWSQTLRKGAELWGMATGWGLDANVKEAYRFLMENYAVNANGHGDSIHIFGFSRGAYTARVLAGFLHAFGLIEPRNLNLLDYAYRAYKRIGDRPGEAGFAELRLHERILSPHRPTIRFLGLFDTVASVIESGRFGPRLRSHAFTATNSSVQSVRHALAIDERRTLLRPQLWPEAQVFRPKRFDETGTVAQDAREVWFSGVHGDIGGGYPEKEAALAKIPLHWMIEESRAAGLSYKTGTIDRLVLGASDEGHVAPNSMGRMHVSMTFGWKLLELLPRRKPEGSHRASLRGWTIPLGEYRAMPAGARIHRSALRRYSESGKRPPNVPQEYVAEE